MSSADATSAFNVRAVLVGGAVAAAAGVALLHFWGAATPQQTATRAASAAALAPADPVTDGVRYQIPVSRSQPARGSDTALVTIVMWGDLGAADQAIEPTLGALLRAHGDDLRVVFRHYLPSEQAARLRLHELARAAHEQAGKFWELRALAMQDNLPTPTQQDLQRYAEAVGLDWAATSAALGRHAYQRHVAADGMFAGQFGVKQAPTLFVNGMRFVGAATRPRLERLIADELANAKRVLSTGVAREALYSNLVKDGVWSVDQTASVAPRTTGALPPN